MSQIKVFTKEKVDELNRYQEEGRFHPYTCLHDGDDHIKFEFERYHKGENYKDYLINEKSKGIPYPHMEFTQTNLIATEYGWICPVCDYKQGWAH